MRERIMKGMGYIVVLLDVAIYFLLSYVFVEDFQNNILTTLVNGALLFIGAMVATIAMRKQGFLNAGENAKYKETLEAHLTQKQKIYPKLSKLQLWLDYDYAKLLKIGRSVFVNSAGYDYEQVFTEQGKVISSFEVDKPKPMVFSKRCFPLITWLLKLFRWLFSDEWRIYRKKKKYISQAKHYKVTRLTVSDIMNVEAERDPNNFGITEKQYSARDTGFSVISRLIFSILLPSISFGFNGFNMATFIVQSINIALIIMTALFSMFCAYSFKVKTQRMSIIKKINKMEEFDNADLNAIISKEENNENICTEKSFCPQGGMVEEV